MAGTMIRRERDRCPDVIDKEGKLGGGRQTQTPRKRIYPYQDYSQTREKRKGKNSGVEVAKCGCENCGENDPK